MEEKELKNAIENAVYECIEGVEDRGDGPGIDGVEKFLKWLFDNYRLESKNAKISKNDELITKIKETTKYAQSDEWSPNTVVETIIKLLKQ